MANIVADPDSDRVQPNITGAFRREHLLCPRAHVAEHIRRERYQRAHNVSRLSAVRVVRHIAAVK